jgi:hypothetical protein
VTLKNIGNSKVELNQVGSGYRVWIADGANDDRFRLIWSGGKPVFSIFEDHRWIEPGESIVDELTIFSLPLDCVAAKVEVRLSAAIGWPRRKNTIWKCSAVVGPKTAKGERE